MTYRKCNLDSIKSDYVRARNAADARMIRRCGYMLFWVAAIVLYAGAMYG